MKVLDNLENYDIPAGYLLSTEQEAQLASDLKDIVHALIPIRGSKLKTRQYFNTHLRKGSDAYGWDSELIQPALLDILEPDRLIFGFVINLLNSDIALRDGYRLSKEDGISDTLVKIAQSFDLEDIERQAQAETNLYERVRFLNDTLSKFKKFNNLSRSEEMEAGYIGEALLTMYEGAEKELKLSFQYGKQNDEAPKAEEKSKSLNYRIPKRIDVRKGVLYDLSICSNPEYSELRTEVHGYVLSDRWSNENAFSCILRGMFSRCFHVEVNFAKDEFAFETFPLFLSSLMDSYICHLRMEYGEISRDCLRLMYEWVRSTAQLFDKIYQRHPKLYSMDVVDSKEGPYYPSIDTISFKHVCLFRIYQCFWTMVEEVMPERPVCVANLIPFNMWGSDYERLRKQYSAQLGLDTDKRAVIFVDYNRERFSDYLVDQCVQLSNSLVRFDADSDKRGLIERNTKTISEHFHACFRDYFSRVKAVVVEETEADDALLTWILDLVQLVVDCYALKFDDIKERCSCSPLVNDEIGRVFFDVYERVVFEIAHEYFLDSSIMPLLPEKQPVLSEEPARKTENVTQTEFEQSVHDQEASQILHTKTIDYSTLYEAWNEKAFTHTSLEDFTKSVDSADFEKMLARAEDAGRVRGFVCGVKYMMKNLGSYLGNNWYEVACASIGSSPKKVNKINSDTKHIKKIDVRILKSCIH